VTEVMMQCVCSDFIPFGGTAQKLINKIIINSSVQCRIKATSTWEIRDPSPTWNHSFIFIYDLWKCKSCKNWKSIFFSNWNDSKRIFGPEI